MMFAQQVRVDPQDNVWIVDQMSGYVMKLDPTGLCLHARSARKRRRFPIPAPARARRWRRRPRRRQPARSGRAERRVQPADRRGLGRAGNIFVADGLGNARVAKFNSKGVFVKSWGSTRNRSPACSVRYCDCRRRPGQRLRRRRRQQAHPGLRQRRHLQDAVHQRRHARGALHDARTEPVSLQFNSNPPEDFDAAGEIYKLKLDGTVVGKFGRAGKLLKEFGTVNSIDCRSENCRLVR